MPDKYTVVDGVKRWDGLAKSDPYGAITAQTCKNPEQMRANGRIVIHEFMGQILDSLQGPPYQYTAIDYGCGTGRITYWLADYFAGVFGVDSSPTMIDLANRDNSRKGVAYLLGNGSTLPLPDDSADVLFTTIVFHHMPMSAVKSVLQDARRVLRNGGIVAFQQGCFPDGSPYLRDVEDPINGNQRSESQLRDALEGYEILKLNVAQTVGNDCNYWALHIARVVK